MAPSMVGSPAIKRAALAAIALLLCACAVAPSGPIVPWQSPSADFDIEGRLSARHGKDALTANFRWTNDSAGDVIRLATPLGQSFAQLRGTTSGVQVDKADGTTDAATDWDELTRRALGIELPVDGLASWIRGVPVAGSDATFERSASGRPELLRQNGWEIVYAYADAASPRPARVTATYPDVDVRIVIDRWN
jgi:outer membrane lipoprotein LolB